MKYKIKIEEIKEEKSYGDTIYEQIYETEDEQVLTDIIKVVNGVQVTY